MVNNIMHVSDYKALVKLLVNLGDDGSFQLEASSNSEVVPSLFKVNPFTRHSLPIYALLILSFNQYLNILYNKENKGFAALFQSPL
jgi:hypothetical protein